MQGKDNDVTHDVEVVEGVEYKYLFIAQVPHANQGLMPAVKEVSKEQYKMINEQIRKRAERIVFETLDNPGSPLMLVVDNCFSISTVREKVKTESNIIIARDFSKGN